MEVSSGTTQPSAQIDSMKKALQSQEEMAAKVLESSQEVQKMQQAQEQQQVETAQKTGMGNSLDIQG